MKKTIAIVVALFVTILCYISMSVFQEIKTMSFSDIFNVQFTPQDQKNAEMFLKRAEKMTVYIERMGTDKVGGNSSGEEVKTIPQGLIAHSEYIQGIPLWKGAYPAEVLLDNGKTVLAHVSCYGSFFSVSGFEGYFVIGESDREKWEAAMGLE